jgi:hypothetical protein
MGTKNNPGNYDCYASADPDEPMFVLLARDKHAPSLVKLWAIMRQADGEDVAKIAEAMSCAANMEEFARGLGKNPVENSEPFEKIFMAATEGLAEHPEGFDQSCQCHLCLSYGDDA